MTRPRSSLVWPTDKTDKKDTHFNHHQLVNATAIYPMQLSNETLLAAVVASANAAGTNWGPAQKAKAGENPALVEA